MQSYAARKQQIHRSHAAQDIAMHRAMTEPSKRDLREMLAEAVRNTTNQQKAEG